jgi:UDP-N-acetylmuramoyl-tripeptide--D-alanyl-D-alanine ligase
MSVIKHFLKFIVVDTLTFEARLAIAIHKPKIVAVTGNVGKTSTKDAIATVLSGSFDVRKSEKSFNSEIGIPLAVLGLSNAWNNPLMWMVNIMVGLYKVIDSRFPEVLVLEIGADKPGDIRNVVKWLHPDIAVFTRLQRVPVHVVHFKTPEKVYEEKWQLVRGLKKGGVLVVNADDERLSSFATGSAHKVFYGFGPKSDVKADKYGVLYATQSNVPTGIEFEVTDKDESGIVRVSYVLGRHYVYPMLAAFAVADLFRVPLATAIERLGLHEAPKGRMHPVMSDDGVLVIDDSYNASPVAVEEALNTLADIRVSGRRIAVLGDMRELGHFSKAEHQRMGIIAGKVADIVIAVGEEAKMIAYGARLPGSSVSEHIYEFIDSVSAATFVKSLVIPGDVVLVKGSQGVRMEKVSEILLGHEKSKHHLARQEKEWKHR